MTESERRFPPEILEKFAAALDGNYKAQARMCLVSRDLFKYTQPRLYHTFNNLFVEPDKHETYLARVIENPHLAKLVRSYTLVSPVEGWPRSVNIYLLKVPNLKHLKLMNQEPREMSDFQDLWHHFFQNDNIPFQLHELTVFWFGPTSSYPFESMALAMFLRRQKALHTFTLHYHIALIEDRDLPNLRVLTIDWRNWDYIVPHRRVESLTLECGLEEALLHIKPVNRGSPIATALNKLKQLRIQADVMDGHVLSPFLSSLEVLILTKFRSVEFRKTISGIPKLRVIVLLDSWSNAAQRRESAQWFFRNNGVLTDVVFGAPHEATGPAKNCCERYLRSKKTPQIMHGSTSYDRLTLF